MENYYEERKQLLEKLYAFKTSMTHYSVQQLKKLILMFSDSFYENQFKEYAIDLIIQKVEEDTNGVDETEFLFDVSDISELIEKIKEVEDYFNIRNFKLELRLENILLRKGYSSLLYLEDVSIEELASLHNMNLALLTHIVNLMIEQGIWESSRRNELELIDKFKKRGN